MIRYSTPVLFGLDYDNGTVQPYSPVWSGTGLVYSGTPATGSYIKLGKLVIVQIDVIFTNVSNFGTGQYSITLPINSLYHTDVYGGSVHQITNQGTDHYSIKGHLVESSNVGSLWIISGSSEDQPFTHQNPVNIDTNDKFHLSFTYICE